MDCCRLERVRAILATSRICFVEKQGDDKIIGVQWSGEEALRRQQEQFDRTRFELERKIEESGGRITLAKATEEVHTAAMYEEAERVMPKHCLRPLGQQQGQGGAVPQQRGHSRP